MCAAKLSLALLQSEDLFLDAAGDDQLVDENGLVLTETMGTIGGLVFGRRVPPRVVVDHGVGGGQIQSDAAGFQADQKDRHFARLKAANLRFAIPGVAGEDDVVDAGKLQFLFDQRQHAGELREQQDAPALLHLLRQHGHQQIELGPLLDLLG
jgi:hypothetical protein